MSGKEKNIPKRRFKEFKDGGAWEERKLGKVGSTFTGLSGKTKEDFGHGDAKFVTYVNVFGNAISDPNDVQSVEIDDKQNQVKYGDVFFTTSSETPEEVGMSSVWLDNKENVYLNSFCFGYRPTVEFDLYYLAFMLRSPEIRKKFIFLAQGISRYNISKNKVMEMNVSVPELDEQRKVGTFFNNLDNLIALHQRKLDKLKVLKKAYLAQMFPSEGESKPRLRFSGFNDAWEHRKLGDVTSKIGSGKTPLGGEKSYKDHGVSLIRSQNINYDTVNFSDVVYIDDETDEKMKNSRVFNGDVLLNITGASIGRSAVFHSIQRANVNQHVCIVRPLNKEVSPEFIHLNLASNNGQNQIDSSQAGGAREGLNFQQVSKMTFMFSTLEEQIKIGDFFSRLNNLITLHQRKLEKLQNIKKAYLNEMFV